MTLTTEEIRRRAERFATLLGTEWYEIHAGLKPRPELTALFESERILGSGDAIPAVERELAGATGEEERRCRALLGWVAENRVEAACAPLDDEYLAWEATTTLDVAGRELPLRRIPALIAGEEDRSTRQRLEAERNALLSEVIPLQLDRLNRGREAVRELGYGGFVQTRERLWRFSLVGLLREAGELLEATEDAYQELLAHVLRRRLELDPAEAERSDLRWLWRAPWLDDELVPAAVTEKLREQLKILGFALDAHGRIQHDTESRPLKPDGGRCVRISVPARVMLLLDPVGGRAECAALLSAAGCALQGAYTAAELPFEQRVGGDPAVPAAFSGLFSQLLARRAWIRRVVGLQGHRLEEYLLYATFVALLQARSAAVRLQHELELLTTEHPSEWGSEYAALYGERLGVAHDARCFLEGVDRSLSGARSLRGWMLAAMLQLTLRDRYDVDWFRNPAAGPFLAELFAAGGSRNADETASQLGQERLVAGPLARLLLERAA